MRLFPPIQDAVDAVIGEPNRIGDFLQEQRKSASKEQETGQEPQAPPYTEPIVDISEAIRSTSDASAKNEERYQNRNFRVSIAGVIAVVAYTTVAAIQSCTMHKTYNEIVKQTPKISQAAGAATDLPPFSAR